MNFAISVLAGVLVLSFAAQFPVAAQDMPSDAEIQAILQARVETNKMSVGIVVGIVDEHGTRIISDGLFDQTKTNAVDGDTIFEIGSVTKVFTTLLLQDMIERGEMSLTDPVAKFLPITVKVPSRNGTEITLLDLATHTSGLPRMPDNFKPKDWNNPYADYTEDKLYDFLSNYELPRDIGVQYEYSNLGMGLLGHAIELEAGKSFEALVVNRICGPLNMGSTRVTLTAEMQARAATGHDDKLRPVPNWDFDVLASAGALRSSANDLLKFVAANLGLTPSSLTPLMQKTQVIRLHATKPDIDVALAWNVYNKYGTQIYWHNGGTGGFHSFIGFAPDKKLGVVVLSDSANSIDDIAFHLLESKYKLANFVPIKDRMPVKIDYHVYDDYVGQYAFGPGMNYYIRRDGDRLTAQLTGQRTFEIYPESETNFFYTVVNAQITFVRNDDGKVTFLVLHQNGTDQEATKVSDQSQKERVAIKLDPKIYDTYTGVYEFAPKKDITVSRDGDRLMAQLSGQQAFEVYPESPTNFFYKVVDAQLTFVTNGQGATTSVILHQFGQNPEARKIQ